MQIARPKLLLFDVNETLLSLAPIKVALAELDPDPNFAPMWFNSLLHYSLVCSAAGQYFGFSQIGVATLHMLCQKKGIEADEATVEQTVAHLMALPAHDDVVGALARLKQADVKMVTLTNSTQQGVYLQMQHAGLDKFFRELLSVEQVQRYKPHPEVYQWAAKHCGYEPEDCMMVAAHGWDVAGAQWAGLRSAFIARPGQHTFPLAPEPHIHTPSLTSFADAILAMAD